MRHLWRRAGISSDTVVRPSSVSQEELLELIDKMNRDWRVSGLLVQLPLPGKRLKNLSDRERLIGNVCAGPSPPPSRAHQRASGVQRHRSREGRGRLPHREYREAVPGPEVHGAGHACSRLGDHQKSRSGFLKRLSDREIVFIPE